MPQELISAVSKIDTLSNQMANMQSVINKQHSMLVSQEKRLREVEAGKNNGGRDSSPEGAKGGVVTNECASFGRLNEGKTISLTSFDTFLTFCNPYTKTLRVFIYLKVFKNFDFTFKW